MSCLLFVSHPDDDAIFAGALQRKAARHRWTVVCATHDAASPRVDEMRRWQASLGTDPRQLVFLGFPDDPDDRRQGRNSIDERTLATRVRSLGLRPEVVVTHNGRGEYGHPHHQLVHRVAVAVYPAVVRLEFGHGLDDTDWQLPCVGKWDAAADAYPSQRAVIEAFQRDVETFVVAPRAAAPALAARLLEPRVDGVAEPLPDGPPGQFEGPS